MQEIPTNIKNGGDGDGDSCDGCDGCDDSEFKIFYMTSNYQCAYGSL